MIKIINYLIDKLTKLKNRLHGDKGDTPHNEWLKGYWKWRKQKNN
jgi:hypothetical protein